MQYHRMLAHAVLALGLVMAPLAAISVSSEAAASPSAAGGTLYPSTPIFSDNFSSGTLSPFVANNGLTPGGAWSVSSGGLRASDINNTSPLENQIASVPNMRKNVVLDTSFTINQVNLGGYYRIGLFGRGSAPKTGGSQWDLVLDHGNLTLINQFISYPASIPFPIQVGQSYHMQMVIDGNWVGGKVWLQGTSEPSQWTITGNFPNTGNLNTVGVAGGNADVTFHNFSVYPAPPSLTVTPTSTSAVFSGQAAPSYTAQVAANDPSESGVYYVNYLVQSINGTTVSQAQVPMELRPEANATASTTLTLPRLPNGYYATAFSLTNVKTALSYQSTYPGHSSNAQGAPGNASYPPPGHTLTLLPSFSGQTATQSPVDNTTTSLAQVPPAQNLTSVDPSSPFAINGPGNRLGVISSTTESNLIKDYTLFKKQGIQWARTEFMWNFVEPQPGVYTWNHNDGLVQAAHSAHENLLGLLDYWGNYANPFISPPKASFQTAVQEYDQYVQSVVKRYMPGGTLAQQMGWKHYGITAWEVWNEPSTRAFWLSQNPTQYAELVKSAAAAIKAVEPNATILAYNWHAHTILNVAGSNSFTGMSVHDYPGPVRPSQSQFYYGIKQLRQLLTSNNLPNAPIWMTESGFSSNQVTQKQQAEYLVRAEIQSLAGSLNKFFMFSWNYPGSGWGELNGQLLPKPAYAALAGLSSLLNGYSPAHGVNPIQMGSGIRAYAFTNGISSLVALWSNVGDGTFTVPPGNVRAYDWMGNPIAANGGTLTVHLTGEPVFLVSSSSPSTLAKLVQSGTVQGIAPVAITIHNLSASPTTLPDIHLTLTDQINTPQSGSVTVKLPSGWEASASSTTAATYTPTLSFGPLAPSASTNSSFMLTRFESNASNQYLVTAQATLSRGASSGPGQSGTNGNSSSSSSTQTVSTTLPVSAFETIYGHPGLTGTFKDWSGAPPLQLNQASQNVGIPKWSPSVESAQAYTMWNHHYFYFAAKVTDSIFSEPYTGFNQWQGDSVQLFWDPQNTKTTTYDASAGDEDIGIAKTPVGNQAYEFQGPRPGLRSSVQTKIVPGPSGGDMWYEVAIPLSDFANFTASTRHQYGFDFLINDNNGSGRLGWIWLTPGVGNGFIPADFPTFTLVQSAGLAAARLNVQTLSQSLRFAPNRQGALLAVHNNGLQIITVTAPNGQTLTLQAESSATATVTPTGTNPTVPILANGTTTINLAGYLSGSGSQSLTASTSQPGSASAVVAVNNGVNA